MTAQPSSIWASECALWFCIHAYSISVRNGQQQQTLLGTWPETRLAYPNSVHGSEYVFVNTTSALDIANDARYVVTTDALTALRNFMGPLFMGAVNDNAAAIDYSSDWIEAIWNATYDLPGWMSTFTKTLTNEVRQQGTISDQSAQSYDGHGTRMTPFIKVQWVWMMYFAGLILASVYYLLHVIIEGNRDRLSAWKSDALPMLFCRIDSRIHERVGDGMDLPGGLEDRVGQVKVALERNGQGDWTFRMRDDGSLADDRPAEGPPS